MSLCEFSFRNILLERSKFVLPPIRQAVDVGEVAHFVCVGNGSFISISWQYNGKDCSNSSHGDAVVVMEHMSGERMEQHIISTLMIDTSILSLTGEQHSAMIGCVLHQSLPPEYSLQGRENQTSHARLVITAGMYVFVCPFVIIVLRVGPGAHYHPNPLDLNAI